MQACHFCTIATVSHLPFARVLLASLQRQQPGCFFHVLVVDGEVPSGEGDIRFYSLKEMDGIYLAQDIIAKYGQSPDNLRWALKPVFLLFLLQQVQSLIYLDNDIFFVGPYTFLFTELAGRSVLLTPHWSPFHPLPHVSEFEVSLQIGLFNAGFIGVTQRAAQSLRWWADVCLFKMERSTQDGYFVDQRYLDLLPLLDGGAGILRHPGCNLGSWNIHQNKRTKTAGAVKINGVYDPVFIHFNLATIQQIENGNDCQLTDFLVAYKKTFTALGYDFDAVKPGYVNNRANRVLKLKRAVRLRTRVKQMVFRLYQRL